MPHNASETEPLTIWLNKTIHGARASQPPDANMRQTTWIWDRVTFWQYSLQSETGLNEWFRVCWMERCLLYRLFFFFKSTVVSDCRHLEGRLAPSNSILLSAALCIALSSHLMLQGWDFVCRISWYLLLNINFLLGTCSCSWPVEQTDCASISCLCFHMGISARLENGEAPPHFWQRKRK